MKASKKLLSLLLVVMLLVSAIPFQAFAAEPVSVTVLLWDESDSPLSNGTLSVPEAGIILDEAAASSLLGTGYEYVGWKDTAGNSLTDTVLSYGDAATIGNLVLVVKEVTSPAPPASEPYKVTIYAKLDGAAVGTPVVKDIARDVASITLTEALAQEAFTDFDSSTHKFDGWEGGVSGAQTLTADASFTALFSTKVTGYKATIHVYVNGVKNDPAYEKTVTSITLGNSLYEQIANAKGLDVADYNYAFYAGHAVSGTAVTGSTYTLSADATYTIVLTTKTPDPVTKQVHFFVDNVEYAVTYCTEGQQPNVPADPYKANYEFKGWYSAQNGQGTRLVSGQNWNNSMPTVYYAYFTLSANAQPTYDTITVYVQRYVGNVAKGAKTQLEIADNQIVRGDSVLDWLNSKRDEIDGLVETMYNGVYTWSPKYFYDNDSNAKLTSQSLVTNGNKRVFIKVYAPEVKVQLYIHVGKTSATADIKDMHGYLIGSTVTKSAVDTIVKQYYTGSNMVIQGMYTEEDWAALKAGNKPTAAADLKVTEDGMEIHVLVTNATAATADPSNPKTGDYILTTAVTLMVISGLAAAAVYVVGKKRRV